MISIESTGRKLKDAIDNGLAQLGKTLTEVEVEVLDNGGLFRKAKVRITVPGEEPAPAPAPAPAKKVERDITSEKPRQEFKREERHEERREEKHERPEKKEERRERPVREQRVEERKERPHQPRKEAPVQQKEEVVREPRHYEPITPELVKKAEDFVTELIAKMNIEANIDTSVEDGELHINLKTESSAAIGYHGEVLDAIEYMTSYVINHEPDKFYHVVVNCNNYREKRKESLVALANKMAAKCIKVRHKIVLEPMNSNERKIIHSALADNDQIITRSEGHDPNRHVVILCKKR
ncbi:MAG: KH domain-containing protein [Clostridiales bacterium]|nr:KH domain-containing protein [Clostridiales bacterium]